MSSSYQDCHYKFSAVLSVVEQMLSCEWQNDCFVGHIDDSEQNKGLLVTLDSLEITYTGKPSKQVSDFIEVTPPRSESCFFAKDFSDLLSKSWAKNGNAKCFYVHDIKAYYPSAEIHDNVKAYLDTSKLIHSLELVADHIDESKGAKNLIFLHNEKLVIPIEYKSENMTQLKNIELFEEMLNEKVHLEQRKTIFKKIVLEELSTVDTDRRLTKLLERFDAIFERFQDNYRLYVSEFSIESVMDELHDKKLGYISSFNKTVSDIQGQLLSIPVAIIIISSQLSKSGLTFQNVSVLIAAFIFSGLMYFLVKNQRNTIESLKAEIDYTKSRMESKYDKLIDSWFEKTFTDIYTKYENQKKLLRMISVASWAIFLVSLVMFIHLSELIDFKCYYDQAMFYFEFLMI